jgi:hypothetical protein
MWSVNRSVLVVRPRQPYLDWVHALDEGGKKFTLQDLRQECTSYLVSQWAHEDEKDEILADVYEEVFEHELWAWMRDPAVWPRKRDLATFKAWFELELCSVTMDVVGGLIESEEE